MVTKHSALRNTTFNLFLLWLYIIKLQNVFCWLSFKKMNLFFPLSRMEEIWVSHYEFSVLLLESLVAFSQLVGHQLVLVSLLLTGIQLFRQDEKCLLLTLQLTLAHKELHQTGRHSMEVIKLTWTEMFESLNVKKCVVNCVVLTVMIILSLIRESPK